MSLLAPPPCLIATVRLAKQRSPAVNGWAFDSICHPEVWVRRPGSYKGAEMVGGVSPPRSLTPPT
jgi:hypothetical protein